LPKVSEAHRDSRKRQILDAAMECFARKGFQRTSMEDIIRESDLSAGAIYLYFQSKDQIIETLADERHNREQRLIAESFSGLKWDENLRQLLTRFSDAFREPAERKERRLGIHLWAEALCNPKVLRLIRRGINQPLELLSGEIAKAQAGGRLRKEIDPDAAARLLIALFHGFILQQAWDDRVDITAFAKAAREMAEAYFSTAPGQRSATVRKLRAQ
jgi:AcrR family transcriptional regulator